MTIELWKENELIRTYNSTVRALVERERRRWIIEVQHSKEQYYIIVKNVIAHDTRREKAVRQGLAQKEP